MIDKNKKKDRKILEKLQMLMQMHQLLRAKKVINDDWEDEDLDELLSRAELMEETLKNYMYQFGLSIYQNKQGKYYFKQFLESDDLRPRTELDDYHFSAKEQEPNFIEKLLEQIPEEKIMLTTTIESAVIDLYERDPQMAEAFDQLLNQEVEKCRQFLHEADGSENSAMEMVGEEKEVVREDENGEQKEAGNDNTMPDIEKETVAEAPEQEEQTVLANERTISEEELSEIDRLEELEIGDGNLLEEAFELPEEEVIAELDENGVAYAENIDEALHSSYQCGGKTAKNRRLPKPAKIREVPVAEQIMAKENQKER